jgi:hypothetical protein
MLRIPHCLDKRLIDGGDVVSLTKRPKVKGKAIPVTGRGGL